MEFVIILFRRNITLSELQCVLYWSPLLYTKYKILIKQDPFDQFAESKSSEEDEEMQASIEAHVEPDTSEASDENVVEESSPTPTIPSGETDVEHPEESIE